MSSSKPGGVRRNWKCHRADSARPKTRTRFGNSGAEKSSRMARRYAAPATARGIKKDGSPLRPKSREQIVSDTSKITPSPYNLYEGVSFTAHPHEEEFARPPAAIHRTRLRSSEPLPEQGAIPEPEESSRLRRRCRKRVP